MGIASKIVVCALLAGFAAAQPDPMPDLDPAAIEARISVVPQTPGLDADAKERLKSTLEAALILARQGYDARARGAEAEARRLEAPQRLQDARATLATPESRVTLARPPGATLTSLEAELTRAAAATKAREEELRSIEQERERRSKRLAALSGEIAEARKKLEQAEADEAGAAAASDPLAHAEALKRRAATWAAANRLWSLERELASYQARGDLIAARRDVAVRLRDQARNLEKEWLRLVEAERIAEAARAEQEAREAIATLGQRHKVLGDLARENVSLAEYQGRQALELQETRAKTTHAKTTLEEVARKRQDVEKRIRAAGTTDAIGFLLRQHRAALPDLTVWRKRVPARRQRISRIQLDRIEFERQRDGLSRINAEVEAVLEQIDPATPADLRRRIQDGAQQLLESRKTHLNSLIEGCETLVRDLVTLDVAEREVIDSTESYAEFIDRRVLWIRSAPPLWDPDVKSLIGSLRWLVEPEAWSLALRGVLTGAADAPWSTALALAAALLFLLRRRLARSLTADGERAARSTAVTIVPTLRALCTTAALAAPVPLLLLAVGEAMREGSDPDHDLARALSHGFAEIARVWLWVALLRQATRVSGLGPAHFDWPPAGVAALRRGLRWTAALMSPAAFLTFLFAGQADEGFRSSIGRLSLLAALVGLMISTHLILHPSSGIASPAPRKRDPAWPHRFRHLWYLFALGALLCFTSLLIVGYQFTVLELILRLERSIALLLALIGAHALAHRWVMLTRRRLAIERSQAATAQKELPSPQPTGAPATPDPAADGTTPEAVRPRSMVADDDKVDLAIIGAQTRHLLRAAFLVAAVIGLWAIWIDVLPALRVLDEVDVWTPEGAPAITLEDVALAFVILGLTVVAARNVPALLEIVVLRHLPLDSGGRYAASTLARYSIGIVGTVIAFAELGIGWSKVQWLVAAMGVGLGFGLQEIFANFISGLIILFERPVRIGDLVTVGDTDGTVTRIRMRATTVTRWDRKELIIPNKEFITGRVTNWTLSDPVNRLTIPVGVSYGSDPVQVREILLAVAGACPLVLETPKPKAIFRAFGASSLDFELRVFINDFDIWPRLMNELHTGILAAFRSAGVEIPFPQQDLHVKSADVIREVFGEGRLPEPETIKTEPA